MPSTPKISRFDIHDELTAPPESAPILKGALSGSGKLNNFVGVLAGSPAVLRAYARMRSELRRGTLPAQTQERISLPTRDVPSRRTMPLPGAAPRR